MARVGAEVGGRVHVLITTENGQIDRERPMDGDHGSLDRTHPYGMDESQSSRSAVSMGDFMESNRRLEHSIELGVGTVRVRRSCSTPTAHF